MTQSYADVHVTSVNCSFIYIFFLTLNNRWVHGYLFSLRIPDVCKLPGFGYNHLYISLITVQKNRRFTAATIIIHHSRNWRIKPTYDHESPPYTSTGVIVSCVGTKHNSRFFCSGFYNPHEATTWSMAPLHCRGQSGVRELPLNTCLMTTSGLHSSPPPYHQFLNRICHSYGMIPT